jgi:hypothetical protein
MLTNIAKSDLYATRLPWNTYDPEDLGPNIMLFCKEHEPYFRRWARLWFENFQFLYGNQQIRWSNRNGFAVDYDFMSRAQTNSNFAMYVYTNVIRTITESLAAAIYSNLPAWEVDTADYKSGRGNRLAKIVEKLLDAYMVRLMMDKEFTAAAMIYVMFGQVCADVNWMYGRGSLIEIPRMKKGSKTPFGMFMAPNRATQGLIEIPSAIQDQYGRPYTEQSWDIETDSMGRQIIDKIFSGDMGVDMLTPFEYRRSPGTNGYHKTRWAQRFRLLDYDEYLDEYGQLPGKTAAFDQLRPVYHDETVFNFSVRHFMRMQFVTSPTLSDDNRSFSYFRSSLFRYKVYVVEHYDRPHAEKWPQGRRVVIANGQCTHITVPPYSTSKLDGWHPFVEAQWLAVPPSSIASGPVNDAVRKNREVNVKDSLIATAVRRNMGSQLLFKSGSGLDPQNFTGEPGMSHECNDPYAVRWLHDDMPIPPVVAQLRAMDKDDIYESSAAIEAVRGVGSQGATSGYQEKQREEREEKRLAPARKGFEIFAAGIGEKLYSGIKARVKTLAPEVVGFLKRSAAGEFTIPEVITVLSTPTDFGVDVKVKKSSMALKSKATQQATLQELAGGPLKTRLEQDARVLDQYLQYFDAEQFRDGSAPHRDRAEIENQAFMDMLRLGPDSDGVTLPIVIPEDDDQIHLIEHDLFLVKHFEELRHHEWLLQLILTHKNMHRIADQAKRGQVMPGAELNVPAMMAEASEGSPPTTIMIAQDAQVRQQQAQAQAQTAPQNSQQQQQGEKQPPTAESGKMPKEPGQPGPRPKNPATPAQSPAIKGGMQ